MAETVADLVKKWALIATATHPSEDFNQIYERILFLEQTHYNQYVPTLGSTYPDYDSRLETWLGNVTTDEEKQILFQLSPRIMFFSREDFTALYQVAFRGAITRWIVDQLHLMVDDPDLDRKINEEVTNHTWFCPVTDSLNISDFAHVNHLGGIDQRPAWMALSAFGDPNRIKNYMKHPTSLKPGPLTKIVLLEDYIGSGTQMENSVRFAASLDSNISVLLVPLIISPAGAQKARDLALALSNFTFTPVIELTSDHCLNGTTVTTSGSVEEKIIALARTTYASVVGNNAAAPLPYTCFGFMETGAVVVLYSNTPANTLPIIQHRSNAWAPLFPRSARIQ